MIKFIRRWFIEILILSAIVVLGFLWLRARHENNAFKARAAEVQALHEDAVRQAAKGEDALRRASDLQARLDASEAQRIALSAKVERLEADLSAHPMPPKPGPAPTEEAKLVADIRDLGASPEMVPPRLTFPRTDAPTLWTWGMEAKRVPALEERIQAQENLAVALRQSLSVTQGSLSTALAQRDEFKLASTNFEGAFQSEQKSSQVLKVQVASLETKVGRAKRMNVYVGIGSAAVASYLTYRLVKK